MPVRGCLGRSQSVGSPYLTQWRPVSRRKTATLHQHYYPEGGWGWVVLAAALLYTLAATTLHLSMGFFILEIRNQFGSGQSIQPVVAAAASAAMSFFLSPLVVALCKKRSTRLLALFGGLLTSLGCLFTSFASQLHQVYVSYGLLVGSGECMVRETSAIIFGQYFKKRRQEVEMVFLIGYGIGVAVMPLLFTHLIRLVGWRPGLQIVAGVQSVVSLVALLYRPASLYHPQRRAILHIKSLQKRSKAKEKHTQEKKPFLDWSVLKSKTVQIFILSSGITAFGISFPFVLMIEEMQKDEFDFQSMSRVQVSVGVAISIGSAIFGLIAIQNSAQCVIAKQYLCQFAGFVLSGWLLAYPTLEGYYGYVLFAWIYGLFYGGYIYALKACVLDKVRARNYARTWSFIMCSQAIPTGIGLPVIYHLNGILGSKRGYYVSSLIVLIGSCSLFLIDFHKHQSRRKKRPDLQPKADGLFGTQRKELLQEALFEAPKEYGDLKKAQELTCISEEVLVENFLEDYIDDCITSCNKEEKFLMLSEFENNLFKTDESLERSSQDSDNVAGHHYCNFCLRGADHSVFSPRKMISNIEVIDEATSSL